MKIITVVCIKNMVLCKSKGVKSKFKCRKYANILLCKIPTLLKRHIFKSLHSDDVEKMSKADLCCS